MNSYAVKRLPLIDWLRGFAILLMVVYHFCYDLFFFDYLDTHFGKGYWIPFRYVIVISFLILVGVSLRLVHFPNIKWQSLRKRTFQMAVACLFVTLSSYFIAPNKTTVFGILHFIFLASWMALVLLKYPRLSLIIGIIIFYLGHAVTNPMFDAVWLHWIGMVEVKRKALDYVPVFPWLGVVLWGVYLGALLQNIDRVKSFFACDLSESKSVVVSKISKAMQLAGQHSLVIYLVHQPLMFGGFYAYEWLF